ncbi:hypothetical protein HNO88_003090 [Novosphingobium chloroacetimidivorans]|uniref:Uncharacterized protein n=1 Tax=Novosphingobium chloroacetimidivorans TaxID=1428314 RepID=A0A7W7KCW1_9SPHN|nr:hypothetical protein [Novosphingobium chloroacetimidivorans]MBB4859758.1 hypothetical protein [Novosphingobium chloroacetimidivorans]
MRTGWVSIVVPALIAAPALARDEPRPITDREPDVVDVAKTPMTDLNLSRTEIPALLAEAELRPYALQNLETCKQLSAAVSELDAILGPDLDLPQAERARLSKGRIAQWAVGTFIPFRSLIREVSGANRQERAIRGAIQAGLARRGFLKGVGAARNCPYPASPATETIVAQHIEQEKRADDAKGTDARITPDTAVVAAPSPSPTKRTPVFTSEPVVQQTR